MVASLLIIGFSFILLAYWFRYSCTVALRSQAELATCSLLSSRKRFGVVDVLERGVNRRHLEALHASIDRDYRLLSYLLRNGADLELTHFEDRLLVLDYKLMQCCYRLTRGAAPSQARRALAEMASVVGVLAGKIERAATNTQG